MIKKSIENIIPKILIIIFLWSVFSYLHKVNFFSLSINKILTTSSLGFYRGDPLLKGDKIIISYYSKYPNLGTVGIRFSTFYRINSDILRFRIKELGKDNWYYENDYKVDQFQNESVFPFGFPLIKESSKNNYIVEIESLGGVPSDSVAITSPLNYSVVAKHVFTKDQLLGNPKVFFYFIFHKFLYLVSDLGFLQHLFTNLIPLVYYFIYSLVGLSMGTFSVVIYMAILIDILFVNGFSSLNFLSIVCSWGLLVWQHRIESKVTSFPFLVFLPFSVLFFIVGFVDLGDKLAVWTYLFFILYVLHLILEIRIKPKNLTSKADYKRNLLLEWKNIKLFIYLVIIGEINITAERVRLGKSQQRKLLHQSLNLGIKDEALQEVIALVVYRWNTPMYRTYLYTSKLISYLVIILVTIIELIISYGPQVFLGWLIWKSLYQIRGFYFFFQEFFVENQIYHFWQQIGNKTLFNYLLGLLILLFVWRNRKLNSRKKILAGIITLYICLLISRSIFYMATPYRDDVKIWSVGPNGTQEAWVDVTIVGRNFGEMPFTGKVLVNGVEQRIIRWKTNEIIFRTDPFTTRSGHLIVKNYSKQISNSIMFIYKGIK